MVMVVVVVMIDCDGNDDLDHDEGYDDGDVMIRTLFSRMPM
jgi:hypothetical protein